MKELLKYTLYTPASSAEQVSPRMNFLLAETTKNTFPPKTLPNSKTPIFHLKTKYLLPNHKHQKQGIIKSKFSQKKNFPQTVRKVCVSLKNSKEKRKYKTIIKISLQPKEMEVRYIFVVCQEE